MCIHSILKPLAPLALVGLFLGCGGGQGYLPPSVPVATAATGFTYTNPTPKATEWALVKDATSTSTHLVLKLVGPAGLTVRGVGFNLLSDGSVKFARFPDDGHGRSDNYVKDTEVLQVKLPPTNLYGSMYPTWYEPVLVLGGVKQGGKFLTVGVFQKDRWGQGPVKADDPKGLLQIAMDFNAASALGTGATVPLNIVRARIIPGDIGADPGFFGDWGEIKSKMHMDDIQIAVGTLVTN